jgi:pimeloyl-ACP methyl ester carboxylesterase
MGAAFDRFCTPPLLERSKAASTKFERIVLDLPHYRLSAMAAGPEDGPPTLAVHGWGSQAEFFLPLVSACVRQGLRVYAVDMPAHGRTRDANPDRKTSTLVEWVETLLAIAPHLGIAEWHGVVAHSFGGLAGCFAIGPRPWSQTATLRTRSLSMIAGASGMPAIIDSYAANNASTADDVADITNGVETCTLTRLDQLSIRAVADHLPQRTQLIHDPDDAIAKLPDLKSQLTKPYEELLRPGAGHDGILFQLEVGRAVSRFAKG